ncbi:MAG: hypothetical protein HETSPECPRED_005818 [Heterodermia speciosa]|uniref:Uncharacterized protein n=1 Tax=Heterodermia speciosa TaxID=116794 RepID=A0A8H3IS47_9LECA|nr:MAG: hypothetical protein HETSPECPRED_005818 [Heterodermia speciosa]
MRTKENVEDDEDGEDGEDEEDDEGDEDEEDGEGDEDEVDKADVENPMTQVSCSPPLHCIQWQHPSPKRLQERNKEIENILVRGLHLEAPSAIVLRSRGIEKAKMSWHEFLLSKSSQDTTATCCLTAP